MKQAILINVNTRTIESVQFNDWRDMNRLIGSETFTTAGQFTVSGDTAFCDDEGLLTMDENSLFVRFTAPDFSGQEAFVGSVLITGDVDEDGETLPTTKLSVEDVKQFTEFLTVQQVKQLL